MPRLPLISPPTDFFDDAACRGVETDVFFPVSDAHADEAKAICATCPVREQCLEFALEARPAVRRGFGRFGFGGCGDRRGPCVVAAARRLFGRWTRRRRRSSAWLARV